MLRVELRDGSVNLYQYAWLERVQFLPAEETDSLTLFFNRQSVRITGKKLRELVSALQRMAVEWVKERSHLTRGVTIGTMLRDEAFHFTRIGTFLERADSTARVLTAHQSDLMPGADAGVVPDPYQWSVLLRALSAFEVYRRVYRDVITPSRVAELLILRDDMPRSLLRCCKEVYGNVKSVANQQSAETLRRAGEMHAQLHFARMEELLGLGLPSFLQQFLGRLSDLGSRIASDFLGSQAET